MKPEKNAGDCRLANYWVAMWYVAKANRLKTITASDNLCFLAAVTSLPQKKISLPLPASPISTFLPASGQVAGWPATSQLCCITKEDINGRLF